MLIIGHRGARGLAPESSLASFQCALDAGVDAIECDVRVTRDGVAVITHDGRFTDSTGKARAIAKTDYAELHARQPDLQTLEAIIRYVDRSVPLYIEVKPGVPTQQTVAVLKRFLAQGWQPDDFRLLSFSYKTLRTFSRELPTIGLIVNDVFMSRACYRAKRLGTTYIDMYSPLLTRRRVAHATRRGFHVLTFPQNNVAQSKLWQDAGLAGVITDYPDAFIGL